ncbi:MAG: N-acetyltransferase [Acidobacteria bacterium]|nr:N-acetyltransferase [Acidobacteriota bacterium]
MEMMPYHPHLDRSMPDPGLPPPLEERGATETGNAPDWRMGLPVLDGQGLTLRELEIEDAPALFAELTTEEVARFISPPPASVEGFEKFIRWAHKQRAAGQYACFAVVPEGQTKAIGMFQIRMLDNEQHQAEWGFALGSEYWGKGLFVAGSKLALEFAFGPMEVKRLEARSAVPNLRGNGALRKIGAVREAVLRQSFERHGELLDQTLWTILREDWRRTRGVTMAAVPSDVRTSRQGTGT